MKTIWLETDLEPDDVLALAILKPYVKWIVVGEGNSQTKYRRILEYKKLLSLDTICIEGLSSSKIFKKDGEEFGQLNNIVNTDKICYTDYFEKFAKSENPIMFSLKPMRELLMLSNNSYYRELMANITFYCYGSWNLRTLARDIGTDPILEILNNFKKTIIYESYYVSGQDNSANQFNYPKMFKIINSKQPFFDALRKLCANWNNSILEECNDDLKKTNNTEEIARTTKIINNIKQHGWQQMVIADFGLAAVATPEHSIEPIKVFNLKFDNGYLSFDKTGNESKIYFYQNIPHQKIEELVCKKIEYLL